VTRRPARWTSWRGGRGVHPTRSADDLACDGVFETDEEFDEFLAHLAKLRRTDRG
jgi:hypothetical protein